MRMDVGSCAKTWIAISGAASLPEENQLPPHPQQPLIPKVLQREAELRELLTVCAGISDVVQALCKHSLLPALMCVRVLSPQQTTFD